MQKSLVDRLLILLLIIFLLIGSFMFGRLYNQKQTITNKSLLPSPSPTEKSLYPKNDGWIKPTESGKWDFVSVNTKKTINYSYKYPQNLYKVLDVRGGSSHSAYFFTDQKSYQQYADCVNNGSIPLPGQELGRDFEGGCDLNNLLFVIYVFVGGEEREYKSYQENVENYDEFYSLEKLTWTIPKENAYKGGMGDSEFIISDAVFEKNMIKLTVFFPSTASESKTKELTNLSTEILIQQILATFKINIVEN